MGMDVGGKGGSVSDINVTPFCDVCLVLLIIFMVVTPMLQEGVQVNLPPARNPVAQPDADKEGNIILSVVKDSSTDQTLVFNGNTKVALTDLQSDLSKEFERNQATRVFLKAAANIRFSEVKKVLQVTQTVGFKQIGLLCQHVDEKGLPIAGNAASNMSK